MNKNVIKSKERGLYFMAIHSFTPMYGEKAKARQFRNFNEAYNYAMNELFTTPEAFEIEEISA